MINLQLNSILFITSFTVLACKIISLKYFKPQFSRYRWSPCFCTLFLSPIFAVIFRKFWTFTIMTCFMDKKFFVFSILIISNKIIPKPRFYSFLWYETKNISIIKQSNFRTCICYFTSIICFHEIE